MKCPPILLLLLFLVGLCNLCWSFIELLTFVINNKIRCLRNKITILLTSKCLLADLNHFNKRLSDIYILRRNNIFQVSVWKTSYRKHLNPSWRFTKSIFILSSWSKSPDHVFGSYVSFSLNPSFSLFWNWNLQNCEVQSDKVVRDENNPGQFS